MSLDPSKTDAQPLKFFTASPQRSIHEASLDHENGYSPSRGFKSGQPKSDSITSLKITDKLDDANLKVSDLNSLMSIEQTKKKENTGCSTQAASTSVSHLEKSESKPPKSSFFSRLQRPGQDFPASAELKLNFRNCEEDQDASHAFSFLGSNQREAREGKQETRQSDEDDSSDSECSGVELSLADNSKSLSNQSLRPDDRHDVAKGKQKVNPKGNLDIDEPNFSDSSSCNFSFEYLREDNVGECLGDISSEKIDFFQSYYLSACRSNHPSQTTLGSCKRGVDPRTSTHRAVPDFIKPRLAFKKGYLCSKPSKLSPYLVCNSISSLQGYTTPHLATSSDTSSVKRRSPSC